MAVHRFMNSTPSGTSGEDLVPCCQKRGRPRIPRVIPDDLTARCYTPRCNIGNVTEQVVLLPDELEILRLIDLEGMEQEEAAAIIGVSRKTLWRDLHSARRKVADALINGKGIQVEGCARIARGTCPRRNAICPKPGGGECPARGCSE